MFTSAKSYIVLMGIGIMSTKTKNTIISYRDLYSQYGWFSDNYPPVVQDACDEFFLPGINFVLEGISKNVNSLMDKDSYFVTKICIDTNYDMFFRISQQAVSIILDRALGKAPSRFNLNRLTELESKIITSFNDFLYNSISEFLSPVPPTIKRLNFDVLHLTFVIKDEDTNQCGKFIITLPEDLVNAEKIISSGEKFSNNYFLSAFVDVAVRVGRLRCKLVDIKGIEVGDTVVMDDSNKNTMTLIIKGQEKNINIKPNENLKAEFEYNNEGEGHMAEDSNLWDSIEVDVVAQFDAVKITLGDLKKIEEGLVVDLTSLYNNKITLHVENKSIASGELVIINDRYGVKINEIFTDDSESTTEETTSNSVPNPPQQEVHEEQSEELPQQEANNEEEEFDYSDFELEDEDI